LEQEYNLRRDERTKKPLDSLQAAIISMFNYMNKAFDGIQFEPQSAIDYLIRTFSVRFDVIFSPNQDFLLERHYQDGNIALSPSRKWNGWQIPGVNPFSPPQRPLMTLSRHPHSDARRFGEFQRASGRTTALQTSWFHELDRVAAVNSRNKSISSTLVAS
jgi:hypothetical protein